MSLRRRRERRLVLLALTMIALVLLAHPRLRRVASQLDVSVFLPGILKSGTLFAPPTVPASPVPTRPAPSPGTPDPRSTPTEPDALPLSAVTWWAYQIQDISIHGAVDALAASDYDMLVLEPTRTDWSSDEAQFDTRAMTRRLKASRASDGQHRKLLLAYVDIGEAEDWRWYWKWSTDWDCRPPRPADWPEFILSCDPDGWAGNYPVAYWDPAWKDIMLHGRDQSSSPFGDYISAVDEVIRDGFDGIYLDWVEGYEDASVVAAAARAGKDPAAEMVAFIAEIRAYARARNPDFLVVQQNAAALIVDHPELVDEIDAIAQEAVWYDGDATDDWDDPDGYDWINEADLVDYYIEHLAMFLDLDVPVFDCEYALELEAQAYAKARALGYKPYVTRRSLSRLTTTPPGP